MTGLFSGNSESLGIILLRVLPDFGVTVHKIHGNQNHSSSRNADSVQFIIFSAFSVYMRSCGTLALAFLNDTVQVLDVLNYFVQRLVRVGFYGFFDL